FRSVRSGTILDTGPIVAYLYRRDAHHDWAVDAFGDLDAPVITCEPVLTEACFLIERNRWPATRVLEYALERNAHRPPRGNRNGGSMRADAALCERADVAADACLVRLAEMTDLPICTLDRDFAIYRTSQRQPLQLITPPAPRALHEP